MSGSRGACSSPSIRGTRTTARSSTSPGRRANPPARWRRGRRSPRSAPTTPPARAASKPLFYDGKGEAFRRAVFGKTPPWAIKPNLDEARELLHRPLETRDEERAAVRTLRGRGIEVVLLSCGERGCWVGFEPDIEWLGAPRVEAVSAVGSGDSVCGAFAAKYLETGDVWEAARWGVAAGTANAARLEAAMIGPEEVAPLVPQVRRELGEIRLMS